MNNPYSSKKFNIPVIDGISSKTIDTHLKLYDGYVNNLNENYTLLNDLKKDKEKNLKLIAELNRRINFELAGVQNHNIYFSNIEGGKKVLAEKDNLNNALKKMFGGVDKFIEEIKLIAKTTRGIGWVVASYDKEENAIHILWIDDHEKGGVNLPIFFALDMWEHSYLIDYLPAEKGKYIDSYLNAINWENVSNIFDK